MAERNTRGLFNNAKTSVKDTEEVPEKDKNSIMGNLYSFPKNKKLKRDITVLYIDWDDSTGYNEKYSQNALEKYYRVYCRCVSEICSDYKKVKYIDFQGDGVLIFIDRKGSESMRIAETIDKRVREVVDMINDDKDYDIDDLTVKSDWQDGDVTISKVGRSAKNSKNFQNLVFVGELVSDVVREAEEG